VRCLAATAGRADDRAITRRPTGGEEAAMVIAADYPFLEVVATLVIFFAWAAWIWMMILILTDVFRRRDVGGWTKAAWTVFLIALPFIGALAYLISQHDHMAEREQTRAEASEAALDRHIKHVAAADGPATEIATAKSLLDSGAIDSVEFEQLKQRALAV
jgi:hypothetical protein